MKYGLVICVILGWFSTRAQFTNVQSVLLPDTLQAVSLEWADIDGDSLLDILLISKNNSGSGFIQFYKNSGSGFALAGGVPMNLEITGYLVADYDLDNRIDFIVSGLRGVDGVTRGYINDGDFTFHEIPLIEERGDVIRLVDLDSDGKKELIMSGGDDTFLTKVYRLSAGMYQPVGEPLEIYSSVLLAHDFDGDMDADLFLSGRRKDDSSWRMILTNDGNSNFMSTTESGALADGVATEADVNGDGIFDILISGDGPGAQPHSLFLYSAGNGTFVVKDTLMSQRKITSLFMADMNSDGTPDLSMVSTDGAATFNQVRIAGHGDGFLPAKNLIVQRFGDSDRDGDLDLVQIRDDSLTILENLERMTNLPPGKPTNPLAARLFNRLFLYWDRPVDDHTNQPSITYDLTLQGPDREIVTGEFDLFTGRRTTVSHGNLGFNNFILLKDVPEGQISYFIQSVDNAFHAGPQGICHGSGMPCSEVAVEALEVCQGEKVRLSAAEEALWFSFRDGYLGTSLSYSYEGVLSDTVFSVVPEGDRTCGTIKIYTMQRRDTLTRNDFEVRYVCEGATVKLEAEDHWDTIIWSSTSTGFLSSAPFVEVVAIGADTIRMEVSDGSGCLLRKETAIVISVPQLRTSARAYQIVKGESVQLEAVGGKEYIWFPPTGLDRIDIASPVATPSGTTEYTVTARDSIDCEAEAKILIIVENTAFIPNLFTPNNDGKNDKLRIYGLENTADFSFWIYNREGSLVYRTSDAAMMKTSGWDGSSNGILQPPGVYHWKVHGEYANGKRLLLNGKESGSVVLIR